MKITYLRTNHLTNPLGFYIDKPTFSWIVEEVKGQYQEAARIQVALDEDFNRIVYNSKKEKNISSLAHTVDIDLEPRTRYFWRVKVWTDKEEEKVSETAWFETGKQEESWTGKWVAAPFDKDTHPVFYKRFKVQGKIKSARLYASALGLYEVEINGNRLGNEYLAPFYNDYDEWLQYQTYDITNELQNGDNAIGVILGNGWYKGRFGFVENLDKLYGDQLAFLGEIHITLEDDSTIVIATDESFLCHPSWILESSIYDGEIYDGNMMIENWSHISCYTKDFVAAKLISPKTGKLMARLSPPVIIKERIKPVKLINTPAGDQVIDFGQVMTGWVEFKADITKGDKIYLQYGELLQEGNFYNDNLRSAKAEYTYTSAGRSEQVRPHFTFYGFRYVKVTGLEKVNIDDFIGCVIHSDLEITGNIKTSNPKVNRLFENALWSQRGNFLDVPTDCPQRDERMGWTGDAQVFSPTASYNMYTPAFFNKYLYDMLLEQNNFGGSVPHVVPDAKSAIYRRTGNMIDDIPHGSCAWGDAATVIPWTLYQFFGDIELLEKQYKNMTSWVDYIKSVDEEHCDGRRLWEHGFHFADWLALDNPDKESRFGGTNQYYVSSAYYYYSALLTSKAAKALAKDEDEKYYYNLSQEVKNAIQNKYFPQGQLTEDTQTAMVLALYMDFVPEDSKEQLVERLKEKLEETDVHLTTGFVGTPYLCPALSENGLSDYAYTLLLNEDYPSWLYEVNMGATTIWERWNSVLPNGKVSDTGMNSMNHYAYGSIVEWMYRYMCGINPVEGRPGFKEAIIRPQVDKRIDFVKGEYMSAAGMYKSSWKRVDDKLIYNITIPFDARAKFVLDISNDKLRKVTINGEYPNELLEDREINLSAGQYKIVVG